MSADLSIDLHLHTTCSDGVLAPAQLFDAVRAAALMLFSVTDHDTMAAYPVPVDLASTCIKGIEVDSELHGHTVHLLAYGVDPSCELLRVLEQQRAERLTRMTFIVDKLQRLGYSIELQDVRDQAGAAASLGRPHLARALVCRGIVASVQEAFDRFLADDGAAFVALKRLSAQHIVDLIHVSGGLAVIAHPMRLRQISQLPELVAAGIDGIEVSHPTATAHDRAMLCRFAAERNLFTTGGTDFHAPSGQDIRLGVTFSEDDVERFMTAISRAR